MKSEDLLKRHSSVALLLAIAAFSLFAPAAADTLDAKTLSGLVAGRTWQAKLVGGNYVYFAWNSDGSVCLRLEKTEPCVDTGRWKLDGDSVCYELTWWGKNTGCNAGCYRVASKGDGHHEMIPVDGVTSFDLKILK